jgi:hypothetical protein
MMWVLLNTSSESYACLFQASFIILQGFSGTAAGLLQALPLARYYIKITLYGSTPRSVYNIKYCPRTSDWGALFPSITLLFVITFGYSIISPMINGFAFVTFFLLYMFYKYIFTWVHDHPPSSDTGGLFFPKAIQHVFVGLSVQQICLCSLFLLPLSYTQKPAIIESALMILLMVFTVSILGVRTLSIPANVRARQFSTTLSTISMALSSSSSRRQLPLCRTAAMREKNTRLGLGHRALMSRSPMTSMHLTLINSPTKAPPYFLMTPMIAI